MSNSEVAVVIPAYNAARYIAATIESVLAQTMAPREIIVVDDGSTDETRAVSAKYAPAVRCLSQRNQGVAAARNAGIAESRSRYVAFLDADDVWLPAKLERQVEAMAAMHCRASYTAHLIVDDDLQPLFENRNHRIGTAIEDLLLRGNIVGSPSSVVCERAVFAEVHAFDGELSLCADWEMWIRIATVTDFAYVDEPLVKYRLHPDNMSRNVPLLESDSIRTIEKAFALRALPAAVRSRKRSIVARNAMVLAGSYFRAGRFLDALRCGVQSIARDPRQVSELVSFAKRVATRSTGNRSVTQRPPLPAEHRR